MTSKRLTKDQALLLQRYFDGECRKKEQQDARQLLDESVGARVYISALESLRGAVKGAEREAWEQASVPSADEMTNIAEDAGQLGDLELDELAPLLERFYDDEVDPVEAAVVEGLREEREDVADYLAELDRLGQGVRQFEQEIDDVDFDGFWEGIEEGIDELEGRRQDDAASPVAVDAFEPEEDQKLLHRYHDGETTAEEQRRVQAWLDGGDRDVETRLQALDDIHHGVNAAHSEAVEEADFERLQNGIAQGLDAVDAERAADNVVGLDENRDDDSPSETGWTRPFLAVAAAVALLATGALLGPQLLDGQQPVESEPIVIFDSVESAPGSSFVIDSPEFADHNADDAVEYEAALNDEAVEPTIEAEDDGAEPTVLWVIEDEEDEEDDDDDDDSPEDDTDELPGPI